MRIFNASPAMPKAGENQDLGNQPKARSELTESSTSIHVSRGCSMNSAVTRTRYHGYLHPSTPNAVLLKTMCSPATLEGVRQRLTVTDKFLISSAGAKGRIQIRELAAGSEQQG